MKQRHELLRVYIQQHPCDTNLTVEQLQEMVGSTSSIQQLLMNRLQRYATEVLGSKQYWYTTYNELKALLEQKGPATLFKYGEERTIVCKVLLKVVAVATIHTLLRF